MNDTEPPTKPPNHPSPLAGPIHDLVLVYADALDDIEHARIAAGNRISALTRTTEEHGKGIDPNSPIVGTLEMLHLGLLEVEANAITQLENAIKAHPYGPWIKSTSGVGYKQGARLLAAIGDPYWHNIEGRPRTVSELWAYAGLHVWHPGQSDADPHTSGAGVPDTGVAPHHRRGTQSNWNTQAKTRALLIVASCIKGLRKPCRRIETDTGDTVIEHDHECRCSPYRVAYDHARHKYAHAVNTKGEPLSDGHKDNRARRYVAKRLLRDLWREGRRLHGDGEDNPDGEDSPDGDDSPHHATREPLAP